MSKITELAPGQISSCPVYGVHLVRLDGFALGLCGGGDWADELREHPIRSGHHIAEDDAKGLRSLMLPDHRRASQA